MHAIDPAATAWLLASTALVLLMTPGLAIFYGGMVRTTGVLNMIMMSFISIPLVTVAWLLVGYTIAFSEDGASGFLGNLSHVGMVGITPDSTHGAVPELLYATFQLAFAIITAALVSGAIADRAKFAAWMVFVPVWAIVSVFSCRALGMGTRRLAGQAGRARLRRRPGGRDRLRLLRAGTGAGARTAHRLQERLHAAT